MGLLDRSDDFTALSSFGSGDGDIEVAIVSRFRIGDVSEFDRTPEAADPNDQTLVRVDQPGIANIGVGRGFLVATIPELKLIIVNTHLKSSRGNSGQSDRGNAQKRELVAAAVIKEVTKLRTDFPDHTVVFGGDINVGVTDENKNGEVLTEDTVDGSGDGYDDTHAILSDGLITDTIGMKNLCEGMPSTYNPGTSIPFPAAGAIDVLYSVGPVSVQDATRGISNYGSDHRPVITSATIELGGDNSELVQRIEERIDHIESDLEELRALLRELVEE